MSKRNIETMRDHLFKVMENLNDDAKSPDISRQRAMCETAQTIINSLKVEVELHAILRGAIDVPFIESQSNERPSSADNAPTAAERTQGGLTGGTGPNHPWRNSSVGRLRG